MTILAYEEEVAETPETLGVTYVFLDTGALEIVSFGHADLGETLATWPELSPRATTSATARALEDRSIADPQPRLPDLEIADGLGL